MKKVILLLMGILLFLFAACGKDSGVSGNGENEKEKKEYKVGVVLGLGGLGDKSFNDSAYQGLKKAEEELGVSFKYVEPTNLSEYDQFLTEFAEADYDLIIGISFDSEKGIEKIAQEYPDKDFVIIDSVVDLENVNSIIFNQKEGSFLAGALAQMSSKTKTIGFIGALDIPMVNSFRDGYVEGARYIDPKAEVKSVYIGGSNPFNDPAKAKELAVSLAENNVDVIYTVAGGSGRGVMEAIKSNENLYGIGVDSNQDGEVPGKILTSVLKRVDVAIYNVIKEGLNGEFKGGTTVLGLKENGMELTNFEYTMDIIGEENVKELDNIREDIISGKIKL